jgi:hypothetical protein
MWHDDLRKQALALRSELDQAADGVELSAELQVMFDRCRDDLAVILACTEPEMAMMLEGAGIENFEQLRGLLRQQ